MSGTSEIRLGADGKVTAQSWIRLTGSTCIHCCTYPDQAPILAIQDGPADITITNPAGVRSPDDVASAESWPRR